MIGHGLRWAQYCGLIDAWSEMDLLMFDASEGVLIAMFCCCALVAAFAVSGVWDD